MSSPAESEILAFIANFREATDTFLNGGCYWFAQMLSVRFGGDTLYDPVVGHFIQRIDGRLYDVRGDVTPQFGDKELIEWATYAEQEPDHYHRIFTASVLMKEDDE